MYHVFHNTRSRDMALLQYVAQRYLISYVFLYYEMQKSNIPRKYAKMHANDNLREFVKTHVILAPLREFSRSRAASKIPFPGAQAGQPGKAGKAGEPEIFHFRCKNRYLRSRVIWKVKKHCRFLTFFGRLFHLSCKNRYLRFRRMRNDRKTFSFFDVFCEHRWKLLYYRSKCPCRPSARPSAGPGPAKSIYINSRSTAKRLLLVWAELIDTGSGLDKTYL